MMCAFIVAEHSCSINNYMYGINLDPTDVSLYTSYPCSLIHSTSSPCTLSRYTLVVLGSTQSIQSPLISVHYMWSEKIPTHQIYMYICTSSHVHDPRRV